MFAYPFINFVRRQLNYAAFYLTYSVDQLPRL